MPKISRTFGPFHFEDLEPHRFEDLVRQLVYDFKDWHSIEGTGRSGSDDGIDIRAFERLAAPRDQDEEDEDARELPHPMSGNQWIIQCKREKELGPKRVAEIIEEIDAKNPPYGYVLAAACNFSKQSYDRFRDKLIEKGVMEFHLWGKAELEDMLCQPKNDHILFAFFGISLVTRRRSRSTAIRRTVSNKNKLFKELGTELGHVSVLVRNANDEDYPFKDHVKDFDVRPRWRECLATSYHPRGLVLRVREYFGFVDQVRREFDFTDAISLLMLHGEEDDRDRWRWHERREIIEDFWNHLPHRNKCYFVAERLLRYDDMLVIDGQGIAPHKFTHIFVDTEGNDGPFSGGWDFAELRRGAARHHVELEDYRRIKVFPDRFPDPVVGTIHPEGAISIDSETARLAGLNENVREFFLLAGQHDELKLRDVITVKSGDNVYRSGQGGRRDTPPTYLQVTFIEDVRVGDLYAEEERFRLRELVKKLGRELADDDVLKRIEFVQTYGRKIGKNDFG